MPLSRRRFIQGSAALPLGALAQPVRAERALPAPLLRERALGAARLTTISDGYLELPGDFYFDQMPQEALLPILQEHGISREAVTSDCNLTLYRDGTHTVLFDVGSGPDFMPTAGKLAENLEAAALTPEDITHVVITHAHPDHIWGLLDDFDDPLFPEASYFMGRAEWDYWWNPETVDTIGEARAAFAVGAKRRMEVIEDAIELLDDGAEFLPGIAALNAPGHTPGHMAFEIRNGSDAALVGSDAIGNSHVALHHPEWISSADDDGDLAATTRKRLLDRLAAEKMTLVGFHLPGGGMGRVERAQGAYRFISEDT